MTLRNDALSRTVADFNARVVALFGELDGWIRRYPAIANAKQIRRADALQSALRLKRIGDALHWGPSVALYGESQCGKSNLVSRFATGLGAKERLGNLLVTDPWGSSGDAPAMPWHQAGENGRSIDFIQWIDPGAGKESTGVVCRFTRIAPRTCKEGCFRVEFMSHSELLCSLAMGFNAQIADTASDNRRARISDALDELAKSELVPDPEGRMGDLFEAWDFLKRMLHSTPLMQDLDSGQGRGWDEFVEECLRDAKRPKSEGEYGGPSPLEKLVSMLWDGNKSITSVWRILHADLEALRGLDECCISAEDVCKNAPTGGRNSLVAVDEIDRLKSESQDTCLVYGVRRGQKVPGAVPISRASIVALAREFVLPVGEGKVPDPESAFDVLDYPGARAEQQHSTTTEDKGLSVGREALLRGKINRLFLSGVDHYDATALCLVIAAGGNLEAGKPVRRCLAHWLKREGWSVPDDTSAPSDAQVVEPPLILAITKSDLLTDNWSKAQNRLEAIKKEYSPADFDWMGKWRMGRPYDGIYWVHNPAVKIGASGRAQLHSMEVDRKDAFLHGCLGSRLIQAHTSEADKRLNALFGNPPRDVDGLLEGIRYCVAAAGARRVPGLAARVLDEVRAAVAAINAGYMGPASREAVERAERDAAEHLSVLSELSISGIASLLEGLSIGSGHVLDAWKRARERWAREEPDAQGSVPFECFYEELVAIFSHEFKRKVADSRWRREVVKRSKDLAASIESRLGQLPNSRWFRDAIERKAGPLLAQNAMGVRRGRLLLVVSAQWNRSMVWLAADPPPGDEPLPDAPVVRSDKANCRGVMAHWNVTLGTAYRNLVDERSLAQPYNLDLGRIRDLAAHAINSFRATLDAYSADPEVLELLSELASLSVEVSDSPAGVPE